MTATTLVMQGTQRGEPSKKPAVRLPIIAPKDDLSSSASSNRSLTLHTKNVTVPPRARLPPRSRTGCWCVFFSQGAKPITNLAAGHAGYGLSLSVPLSTLNADDLDRPEKVLTCLLRGCINRLTNLSEMRRGPSYMRRKLLLLLLLTPAWFA
jgi:hypothetical protein